MAVEVHKSKYIPGEPTWRHKRTDVLAVEREGYICAVWDDGSNTVWGAACLVQDATKFGWIETKGEQNACTSEL